MYHVPIGDEFYCMNDALAASFPMYATVESETNAWKVGFEKLASCGGFCTGGTILGPPSYTVAASSEFEEAH